MRGAIIAVKKAGLYQVVVVTPQFRIVIEARLHPQKKGDQQGKKEQDAMMVSERERDKGEDHHKGGDGDPLGSVVQSHAISVETLSFRAITMHHSRRKIGWAQVVTTVRPCRFVCAGSRRVFSHYNSYPFKAPSVKPLIIKR